MNELIKTQLTEATKTMEKALTHTDNEFLKIRAGKAMPSMVDSVSVDYYGSNVPLSQVANVNTPDARTIIIQPWEKTMISAIERAIMDANLGFNPQNDGILIRIAVPPLTEDRRKEMVKRAKNEAEQGKITIRNARKDANERIKKLGKDGVSEDEIKTAEAEVQKLTDTFIVKVDKMAEAKEKEILTV